MTKYISTRGGGEPVSFSQAVLEGLARDGGLLVPEYWPEVSDKLEAWSALSYQELAVEIFSLFAGDDIPKPDLKVLVDKSYSSFKTAEVTPLIHGKKHSILNLYDGPTFAFKDVALQFLGNLFEYLLEKTGEHLNIVGATSGDTGSAAIYGVRGKKGINIFILHPEGKVSPIQEKQMTTVLDDNVVNIAVKGHFDDAQNIVKEIFNDLEYKDRCRLGAVNSINWARIMAQVVYYFYSAFKLEKAYPGLPLQFSVPTGNFGDIFAGYVAKKMGLPIQKLVIGTNENDILARVLATGEYKMTEVVATISPSMDIQISSNFERLLFDIFNRCGDRVKEVMADLSSEGRFTLSELELSEIKKLFAAQKVDTEASMRVIASVYEGDGLEVDPHTAVGIGAAEAVCQTRTICLATAHPAKFAAPVSKALGHEPAIPEGLQGICDKESRKITAEASAEAVRAIIDAKL